MASATMSMTAWALDECGICNGLAPFTSVDVLTSPLATATATAANSTPWACAVVTAQRTPMPTASATMSMTAWANSTSAASATVLAPSTSADALTSQKETATATATSSTRLACAAVCAADADGICDDVDDCVGARRVRHLQRSWRHLRVRMLGHQKETATATKAARRAWRVRRCAQRTPMESATMSTTAWVLDECGICNGPGAIYERMLGHPEGDCDCDGNQLDALGVRR